MSGSKIVNNAYTQASAYKGEGGGAGGGQVDSVVAGAAMSVDSVDPANPIVINEGTRSVVAGTGIDIDNTDPRNPVITNTGVGGQVDSVVAGAAMSVDSADPANPIVINEGTRSVVAGTGIDIDNTDPRNPVISTEPIPLDDETAFFGTSNASLSLPAGSNDTILTNWLNVFGLDFDAVTGEYTIPKTGTYLFSIVVGGKGDSLGLYTLNSQIRTNGNSTFYNYSSPLEMTQLGDRVHASFTIEGKFTAGQKIALYVANDGLSPDAFDFDRCQFSGHRLNQNSNIVNDSSAILDRSQALKDFETDGVLWQGGGGGQGNTYFEIYIPSKDGYLTEGALWASQAGGTGVDAVALYDEFGNLLVKSANHNPVVGFSSVPFTAPVMVTKNQVYYRAFACNQNGTRYLQSTGKFQGSGPTIAGQAPNVFLPNSIAGFLTNKKNYRYYIGLV